MKSFYMMLSMVLMSAFFNQQLQAQNSYSYNSGYDLSDYLDLQAVASAFSYSDDLNDFERRLNSSRNPISNLDLNNDGYIDYLRLVKFTDRNHHVIIIQAALGRDYFQDVATILIGRDSYNRNFVQFIGDPYLYGNDYIIEPLFGWEPKIVRWLWYSNMPRYVSPYFWGYYPGYYRVKRIVTIPIYIKHVHRYVSPRHDYRYADRRRTSISVTVLKSYERKDYWRNYPDRRFEIRHSNVRNSRDIRATPERSSGRTDVRTDSRNKTERKSTVVNVSGRNESTRRESGREVKTTTSRESSSRATTTTSRDSNKKTSRPKESVSSGKKNKSQPAKKERSSSSSSRSSSEESRRSSSNNSGGGRR